MRSIAVVGLGEAGALYARGLQSAGAEVHGFDPYVSLDDPRIPQHRDLADAVRGVDAVLSLVGAQASEGVAAAALPLLSPGSIYGDLNTASPTTKRRIASQYDRSGRLFADVAVLAPVPREGVLTPLLLSGSGSTPLASLLGEFRIPTEDIGGEAGDAATRKLLRSVFMKGLAALVLEATTAGTAAGQGEWLREQMEAELGEGSSSLIDRLLEGSRAHARRRKHEMVDAAHFVAELGTPTWVTDASYRWLDRLEAENQTTEKKAS